MKTRIVKVSVVFVSATLLGLGIVTGGTFGYGDADSPAPAKDGATQAAQRAVAVATIEPARLRSIAASPAAAESPKAKPGETAAPDGAPAAAHFEPGDKVKVVFYERVDDQEADKWGRASSAMRGFQQRPELSGDYEIRDDGAITLPLLGSFPAVDHTAHDVQTALAAAFKSLTGRGALVTVVSVERPPIYVLGPVKNPGPYKFAPGMTVLHAIALAGGFGNQDLQPWQQIEAVREVENGRGSLATMPRLIARLAILKAERDGAAPRPPARLLQLVNQAEAEKLINDQVQRRSAILDARRTQSRAIASSLQAAQQEAQRLSSRQQPLDGLIKLRQERLAAIQNLRALRDVNQLSLIQAQTDLADAEQRRQDAVAQYTAAQQRVREREQEQAKFQADTRSAIETEIETIEQQVATDDRQLATSQGVLGALKATPIQYTPPAAGATSHSPYEVVRQTAAGPTAIDATALTVLRPGDLVRLAAPEAGGGTTSTLQNAGATPAHGAAPVPSAVVQTDFSPR